MEWGEGKDSKRFDDIAMILITSYQENKSETLKQNQNTRR